MPEEQATSGAMYRSLDRNNTQIRRERANAIGEDAELVYRRKVEDLRMKLTRLQRDQQNGLDFSPDSGFSLKAAENFEAATFTEKDHAYSMSIRDCEIELSVIEKRYEFLFGKKA